MKTQVILLVLVFLTLEAIWAKPPPRYVLQDLGTLPGGERSFALQINNRNQVIGNSETPEVGDQRQERAFLWEDGAMIDLGTLPGNEDSSVSAINDRGQLIGTVPGAYFGATPVNPPAGCVFLQLSIFSLNNHGVIAGTVRTFGDTPSGLDRAFLYDKGMITLLPELIPGGESKAVGVNNHQQLILFAQVSPSDYHPVLYSRQETIDLATLPDVPMAEARAINNRGHVAGYTIVLCRDSSGEVIGRSLHPCLYRHGRVSDLGLLPNTFGGDPVAVNDLDQVVGICFQEVPNSILSRNVGFLMSDGVMYDVQALVLEPNGWRIRWISDINNHGWIVGWATRDTVTHGILLRPVSPPSR